MPDGETVLFTIDRGGNFDEASIAALSLDSGEKRILIDGGLEGLCRPAHGFDFADHAFGGIRIPAIVDRDRGTVGGEAQGNATTDAAATARDKGEASIQ